MHRIIYTIWLFPTDLLWDVSAEAFCDEIIKAKSAVG